MRHDEAALHASAASLADTELVALAARFGGAQVAGLALTGSHARGEASGYSDVDLLRFTDAEPTTERERYRLSLLDGRLVSVSTTTLAAKRAELAQPDAAIWAVAGLWQARILTDRTGELAALIAEALAFTWTPALRAAAASHASNTLAGLAEEVHKLLGALARGDDSATLYATLGVQQSLIRAALVARGVLLPSENAFFDAALRLESQYSLWTRLLRLVIGYDAPPVGVAPALARGKAALWLYVEATRLLTDTLTTEDSALVAEAVAQIHAALGAGTFER